MELMESSMAKLVNIVDLYWYNIQSYRAISYSQLIPILIVSIELSKKFIRVRGGGREELARMGLLNAPSGRSRRMPSYLQNRHG